MLLQLENTNKENVDKLLHFAKRNHLKLSIIDDNENNYFLPGKPLNAVQLSQLIEKAVKAEASAWKMHIRNQE